ncbi:hypothetical protein A9995_02855 [Erythrobacter sp. QSSC1-22B]|nr:hypothetical protein A9995_02855 [Erythrobacter sp. QSSC1-22B]
MTSALALALQAAGPSPEASDCGEPLTQTAMNICAGQAFARADAELNEVWRELRGVAKAADDYPHDDNQPGHWASLLEAQRAWLAYRDAHCRLVGYDARGGSLEPMLVSACKAELTRERTRSMRALLTNQVSGETRAGTEK